MSNILLDDRKPKFDLMQWKDIFDRKSIAIPKNEMEFRNAMNDKSMPIKCMSDEIKTVLGWDDDDLEEECPDKNSKIDKFLKLFDVIYPESDEQKTTSETIPDSKESRVFTTAQSENTDIADTEQLTLEEAQDFLDEHRGKLKKDVDGKMQFKAPTIYEGMSVTVNSNFKIKCTIENISHNNVLIMDNDLENVIAIGEIVTKEKMHLVVIQKKNIDFSAFQNKTQFHFGVLKIANESLTGEIIYKPIKLQMHAMEKTDHVLCIDFGTSNTTAGSYRIKNPQGNEPELVSFADVTQDNRLVDYFPTIVYVEDCEDHDNIKYKFGFDAKTLEKSRNYESSASVFYQIKYWLMEDSSYSEQIEICDANGNTTKILKKDIVRAYLKHVIALAEDYFGVRFQELHFTAPVKMKRKFIVILKDILTEYTIVEDAIDEAGAILFDYVADKYVAWKKSLTESNANVEEENDAEDKEENDAKDEEENDAEDEEENDAKDEEENDAEDGRKISGNVAVIDCGGGTTDLATCEYQFEKNSDVTNIDKIEINTQFTNGDFNYGGNNITYRIMQLIKLKIAVKYGFITEDAFNKVLERSENSILIAADNDNYNGEELYREYVTLYQQCEEFLPTQFNNMADVFFDEDVPKVKRNFYYLWQFAEQVKITFYREEKEVKKDKWDDAIQTIGDIKLNYLYKREDDVLVRLENPLDDLEITITEIRKVIFGDIYNLLNRILNIQEDGLPKTTYNYYRLSGQSCKINIFNELLKEFIPGKKLRASLCSNMKQNPENVESLALKKYCIDGSIRYIMFKKLYMRAELIMHTQLAEQIYTIYFSDLIQEMPALNENFVPKLYPIKPELDEITIVIRNAENQKIREVNISVKNITGVWRCSSTDSVISKLKTGQESIQWGPVAEKLSKISLDESNEKENRNVWMIAIPAGDSDGYGFYVYFIRKSICDAKEEYKVSDGKYYNYESTTSGFFDGKR